MPKSVLNKVGNLSTSWQQQLAQAITDPLQLLDLLDIPHTAFPNCDLAANGFPLKVPHCYVDKMQPGDPNDPLLKQIMLSSRELEQVAGYCKDPVGDQNATAIPGLLHKYHGRVLLIATQSCAVHCRYCFRRHFPYPENQPSRNQWQSALDYIAERKEVSEVILSGGDPLLLSDQKLAELLDRLESISHIKRLRIHSRLPVVLPDRITDELCQRLDNSHLDCCLVIHANHANELQKAELDSLHKLRSSNISLLNQSVLLAGINDNIDSLADLSEQLFSAGILPYYLHCLDPVSGAAHFNVNKAKAIELIKGLQLRLPGYLVPRLVEEIAGEGSKLPIIGL
ncbi:MAG: EF-P beta-lysylation protein EpmB [Gammaproteobacteria bacterium]